MKIAVKQPRNDRANMWCMEEKSLRSFLAANDELEPQTESPQPVIDGDIALVPIVGPIAKYQSLEMLALGGTSTIEVEQIIQDLAGNPAVSAILLYVDSPGGTVAGTTDLAQVIAEANKTKPIWAYASDRCFSSAYWLVSQCDRIYCNKAGFVGSIGVYTVLYDTSKQAEDAGVKVHLVKAGEAKGAEEPGVPIGDLALQSAQDEINEVYSLFVQAVAAGRRITAQQAQSLADGRVHIAEKAKALGLIDGIGSINDALQSLKESMANNQTEVTAVATEQEAPVDALAALQAQVQAIIDELAAAKAEKASTAAPAEITIETPEDRLVALKAIAPDRPEFAIAQFIKGHDAKTAKAELADILASENIALKKQVASNVVEPLALKPRSVVSDDLETIWEANQDGVQEKYFGKKDYFLAAEKHDRKLAKASK